MSAPGNPPGRVLAAHVAALAARLSADAQLPLPPSLLRQGVPEDAAGRARHLTGLLERDPAVFLERHGRLLAPEELACFEPLRQDYEVAFHLRALSGGAAAPVSPPPAPGAAPPLSALAKNRRLAHVERLEASGFFDETEMRRRAPLLYHHHVGRFALELGADAEEEEGAAGGASGSAPDAGVAPRGVAAAMLHAADEAEAAARLRAALAREAQTQPESESSSSSDDDEDEQGDAAAPMADDAYDAAVEEVPDARGVRVEEFRRVMRERFLEGREEAWSAAEYAKVDADVSLDERWARLAAQDAEDAYFDDVE